MSFTARTPLRDVAAAVGDALRRHGVRAVLTGGACASLHSDGAYMSLDVDFVLGAGAKVADVDAAMASLGFRRAGDHYDHPRARFFVEFLRGPLAVGGDVAITPAELRVGALRFLALSPTDSCRDRLAAFYHWNDRQSLEAAVAIAVRRRVTMTRLRAWSEAEEMAAKFEEFRAAVAKSRRETAFQS